MPETLNARNRARLIDEGVAFAVPGNQHFIPALAIDLREYFRTPKPAQINLLSPTAQALFFHHVLDPGEVETTPGRLGERLGYSAMTMGRAFDDLVAAGAAQTRKIGREQHIEWNGSKREFLKHLSSALQNPACKTRYILRTRFDARPKHHLGGQTALADDTDLSPPRIETWAVSIAAWKEFVRTFEFEQVDAGEAEIAVETWSYDPAVLSDTLLADPLSLYAQFRDYPDERIAQAAEKLLKHVLS